jgi:MFS family permease
VAAGVPLFSIIGRFVFGWLGDSIKKKYVMSMALFCVALGTVAFNYAQLSCFIYLFLLVFSSGLGGVNVLRGAMAREYFGRTSFGKITGIIMGFASIGGIVGPTLAGWIFDTFGNYQALWLVLSLSVATAGFFILRIREDHS